MEPQTPLPTQNPHENQNNINPTASVNVPTSQPTGTLPQNPQPNEIYPTQPIVGSQLFEPKKSKKWLALSIVILILLLFIGGVLFYIKTKNSSSPTQSNQATLSSSEGGPNLVRQTYQNKGVSYTLKFYDNATVKKDAQTKTDDNFIIGPSQANKGFPIELMIGRANDTASLQAYAHNKNCPSPTTIAFTVYINSANTNANVCSGESNGKVAFELMSYEDGGYVYIVTIGQYYDHQKGTTDKQYAQEIVQNVDLAQYQSDLKTILSSIQPQS